MEVKTYHNLNLDYLNLMTDGDASMKKMMLDILFEELPVDLDWLSKYHNEKDWTNLKSVCHKLKSTLSFIGNDAMTIANMQIESNAMQVQNLDEIPDLIEKLFHWYPIVLKELKSYYNSLT
ncbi:MAG: Hpt domain-containing protein [Bacteroidia bacterium]|nr:Hpt domain-containing protein [Bacteroidia bacterium]